MPRSYSERQLLPSLISLCVEIAMEIYKYQQGNSSTTGLIAIPIAAIIGGFVAGIICFLYLKYGRKNLSTSRGSNLIVKDVVIAFVCTLGMYLGAMCGNIISGVAFSSPSILDNSDKFFELTNILAIKFFIESFVALFWTSVVMVKFKDSNKLKQISLSWLGLFIIFTLFNSIFYLYGLIVTGEIKFNVVSIVPSIIETTINGVVHSVYGAVYIATNPIDYMLGLFEWAEGNQFVMVKEFPKWSVLLAAIAIAYVPTFGNGFSSLTQPPQST